MELTGFIQVKKVTPKREGGYEAKVDTIKLSNIRSFREWVHGQNDEWAKGEPMTVVYLEKGEGDAKSTEIKILEHHNTFAERSGICVMLE